MLGSVTRLLHKDRGSPPYHHPSLLHAPSMWCVALTLPHEDWGLSSISCVSLMRSPAASFSARPQEQSLHALREVLQSPPAASMQVLEQGLTFEA